MKNLPSLADRAAGYIKQHGLIFPKDRILAAVSGGPDSVALLDILNGLKDDLRIERITVVHFDHRLRGEESDADREFAGNLALQAGLDFRCGTADVRSFAKENKISIEMAGRTCRHEFFRETAEKLGARRIALGHTATDQAEEVLLRLLRGAGPAGLKGMLPAARDGIIRPLLFASREDVIEYLDSRGISFRHDSSNFEPVFRRNALRLRVFPVLREAFHPEVAKTISRFAELARDEESWWDVQVREAWERCGEFAAGRASLDIGKTRDLHTAILRRLLRHTVEKVRGNLSGIQAVHLEPLVEMISREMPGKSVLLPGHIEAVQCGGRLIVTKSEAVPALSHAQEGLEALEINGPGVFEFGEFTIEVEFGKSPAPMDFGAGGPLEVFMDSEEVKLPLEVRSWRPGDRFRPLGMKGSKKLQDFFTDLKIPRQERHGIPILCDRKRIIWVAGLRLDDRVRTGPGTKTMIRARLSRKEPGRS